jgi:protein gp37
MSLFRCYAGNLTGFFNAGGSHPGYPRVFEEPRKFPERMSKAAKLPALTGMNRADKPWLNGLPRLLFVSDMGDALSREIDFDFLKHEIIDVVQSPDGQKHIWIWLTKRPSRMAEFGRWLKEQSIDWPDNLVAATSVTDRATLKRLDHLRQVPARFRMVSIEPLVESIEPDLTGIDWAIVGGESGHHAQPFEITWLDALHAACVQHGTAFFVKQFGAEPLLNGEPYPLQDGHGGDWSEWPERYQIRNVPDAWHSVAVWS